MSSLSSIDTLDQADSCCPPPLRHTRPDILHLNVDGLVTAPILILPLHVDHLAAVPSCFHLSSWRDLLYALVDLDEVLLETQCSYTHPTPNSPTESARFPSRSHRDAQLAEIKRARRYLFDSHTGLFRFHHRLAPESLLGCTVSASVARIADWKTHHPDNYLFLIIWLVADLQRVKMDLVRSIRGASPPAPCRALFEETFDVLDQLVARVQNALSPPPLAPGTTIGRAAAPARTS